MKLKYIIVPIIIILYVSCSRTPAHHMKTSARMRDGGKIIVEVDLILEDKKCLQEVNDKSDQIKRAFNLILKDYKGVQFKEDQRATITKIFRRIFNSLLTCKVLEIRYTHYEIQEYQSYLEK